MAPVVSVAHNDSDQTAQPTVVATAYGANASGTDDSSTTFALGPDSIMANTRAAATPPEAAPPPSSSGSISRASNEGGATPPQRRSRRGGRHGASASTAGPAGAAAASPATTTTPSAIVSHLSAASDPQTSTASLALPTTTTHPPRSPTSTAMDPAVAPAPGGPAGPTSPGGNGHATPRPHAAASPPPSPTTHQQQQQRQHARLRTVTRPLPRVLFLHTGGTLGMDPEEAFEEDEGHNLRVRAGATEAAYKGTLRPGEMLSSLLTMVPELDKFANVDLQVLFNKDSSRVGPSDWIQIARALDHNRQHYDAFIVVHGTDTLAYTAAALSLMLCGFKKPIVLTGSQLPLRAPRTDARQNLLDSIQVATSAFSPPHVALQEVAVCFGGKLMRGNRTQKVNSAAYQAFDSPTYPYLATLGIDVDWNTRVMLRPQGAYKPRFKLDPRVIRVPVVPGSDPRVAYGDLYGRGVRGVVLEAFGVGNLPDLSGFGWLPWLRDQTAKGLQVCLISQCQLGPLQPSLYRAGQLAAQMGVDAGPQMTPECAVVKLMFCLKHPDLALGVPLAGEL